MDRSRKRSNSLSAAEESVTMLLAGGGKALSRRSGKKFAILLSSGFVTSWFPLPQGVTKRCLSWLTDSVLVYEPKCGEMGGGRSQPMSAAMNKCTWSPNKLWRSNSIFILCMTPTATANSSVEVWFQDLPVPGKGTHHYWGTLMREHWLQSSTVHACFERFCVFPRRTSTSW